MRKRFVQITAFILALVLMPTSLMAAEADGEQIIPGAPTEVISTTEDTISPDSGDLSGSPDISDPDAADSDADFPGDNQGSVDSSDELTDSEQETSESSGESSDSELESAETETEDVNSGTEVTESDDEETDPEQETTEPNSEETESEPEQGDAEPIISENIVPVLETEEETGISIRVGLSYGSNTSTSANLWNSTGSGYRFGFYDGKIFNHVGNTSETKISVLITRNLYYMPVMADGYQGYSQTETSGPAVGCVHLQFPGSYTTFAETKAAADTIGGFPAWINGKFVVRYGVFLTGEAARETQTAMNWTDATVVGTSEYGFTVVKTGTNTPVFQYDGGADYPMFVVKPGLDNSVKAVTYYKGSTYYGSFRYERIDDGSITVVNLVDIDDYVRGVIPHEMSPSWPLEALKAQAVSARSYAFANTNPSHKRNHFDVCPTICCQVYKGTGGATAITDQAVDETAGQFAWYEDEIILAVFHSSDGGATENSENVWNEALPYLRGVIDPYESFAADRNPNHSWTKTFSGKQLKGILNDLGYGCSDIVSVVVNPSDTGNVQSLTFVDTNGKNWTISKYKNVKTNLGLKSMRYTVCCDNSYTLSNEQTIGNLFGTWVLDGSGNLIQINASPVYAMTAGGVEEVPGSKVSEATFVFNGSGNGHNLGMSQWGAYAMAKQGFTYDQILKFYFTGIEIHE